MAEVEEAASLPSFYPDLRFADVIDSDAKTYVFGGGGAEMFTSLVTFAVHLTLAGVLFFAVNWIGKHAVEFGYSSTTLFEEGGESPAFNFFLRALSPTVFIIALSAAVVALDRADWRLGLYLVAVYYYALRAAAIFLVNRQRLVSWPRFAVHTVVGIAFAVLAYRYLVLPNRSLLPDLDQMGNELWLAILAFLYAVANKVPLTTGPGARRRNNFIVFHYNQAVRRFGEIVSRGAPDDTLRLIVYSVLVYEDHARPPAIRWIERRMFWKKSRTTGVMQVTASTPLSDAESVTEGARYLAASWAARAGEHNGNRVYNTIADYNRDSDYVSKVLEVMAILAQRTDPRFRVAYEQMWE